MPMINKQVRRVLSLIVIFVALQSFVGHAQGLGKEGDALDTLAQHEVIAVTITPGDTAWSIQSKLAPQENTGYLLYLDSKINTGKELGNVKSGEVYNFLKAK